MGFLLGSVAETKKGAMIEGISLEKRRESIVIMAYDNQEYDEGAVRESIEVYHETLEEFALWLINPDNQSKLFGKALDNAEGE